jgi:hypothetical protein
MKMLVHTVARHIKSLEKFFQNLYRSVSGIAKVLILSKFKNNIPVVNRLNCIVLGNGPSLKESIKKYENIISRTPLVCVNHFAKAEEFYKYKPSYYVLLDPGFFILKQRADIAATIHALKDTITWDLTLFVPSMFRNDPDINYLVERKANVKISFFNYTIVKGFEQFAFYLYKKNLAMPQFYNVLGAAVFLTINMGYKKIWILGSDHSWFKDMYVNEDNGVCLTDSHFYDSEIKKEPVFIKDPFTEKNVKAGSFFFALHRVFDSYYLLNKYATYKKAKIYNSSEVSYIDAFERKKIDL